MNKYMGSRFLVLSIAWLSVFLLAIGIAFANTTITLEKPVHVTTAEGSDLILDIGDYVVEPTQEWLRITPSGGEAVDAHLLEAQVGKHEEKLTDPLALSVPGVEANSHHLVLLLPDSQSFTAHGSYSGIRSRAGSRRLTRAKMQQIIALSEKKKNAQKTEYRTPRMGGAGGNRSYNLDCGNNAVLVGTNFRAGAWLDAVGIICQRVNPRNGSLGTEFTRGPVGGSGGNARPERCNNGNVVHGMIALAENHVNDLSLSCIQWEASKKAPIFINSLCKGNHRCTNVGSGTGGSQYGTFHCPDGKVGKALRGRHGIYVDSVQFVCDFWDK